MMENWILCRYSISEERQVRLVEVGEFSSEKEARDSAFDLSKEGSNTRFVLLTEIKVPIDSR